MSAPTALITGLSGQDGSYLAELLLDKGYRVHGVVHDGRLGNAAHLEDRLAVHAADLRDARSLERVLREVGPDEIYHLAAVTAPGKSWEDPEATFDVVALGTLRLLAVAQEHLPGVRLFLAGSSEIFGDPARSPQDEEVPFAPRNPYGAAKAAAVAAARAYRSGRGLHVSVGIFYNHESPRRPLDFVTRKITWHAAALARGEDVQLRLGDLDARRDWGWAPDYVEGAWRAVRADAPGDYVFATGALHSVRELVETAFARAGVAVEGNVVVDEAFVRPESAVPLVGDASRAAAQLGWRPTMGFEEVVHEMVDHDLRVAA